MIQEFQKKGYEIVDFEEKADIYIINTCTVTNMSDKKSRQFLRQAKKNNPESIVIAVGCYVQVAKEEVEKIPEIDFVLGTNEKTYIVNYVQKFLEENKIINYEASIHNGNKIVNSTSRVHNEDKIENKGIIDDVMQNKKYGDFGSVTFTEKTRAVIKVQDGCDRFCSYCIIPYARGRVRSRKPENIVKEINEISKNGIKEVVITGIHVASYGKDFEKEYKLIDLLEEINQIAGIERIRLGSIEPLLITEDFMERFSKLKKMCHHFHLSLQSGCTETLKRMNRRYTREEFEEIVDRIRKYYNDAILTTDIIVGFPGETNQEFENTYEFLKKIKFYKMHIFKYSPRKGTKAEKMENQVSGEIKEERSKILLKLSNDNEDEYQSEYIEKELEVLFEEKEGEYYKGHTSNYIMVKVKSDNDISNIIKKVIVEDIDKENKELIARIK